jgi:hypothetical protein
MNKLKQCAEYIIEGIYCCFLLAVGMFTAILNREDKTINKETKALILVYDVMVKEFGEDSIEVNNFLKAHQKNRDFILYAATKRKN